MLTTLDKTTNNISVIFSYYFKTRYKSVFFHFGWATEMIVLLFSKFIWPSTFNRTQYVLCYHGNEHICSELICLSGSKYRTINWVLVRNNLLLVIDIICTSLKVDRCVNFDLKYHELSNDDILVSPHCERTPHKL